MNDFNLDQSDLPRVMEATGADLARLAGVTRQAVTDALKRGRVRRLPNGFFDLLDPVNLRYIRNGSFPRNGRPRRISQRAGATRKPKIDGQDRQLLE